MPTQHYFTRRWQHQTPPSIIFTWGLIVTTFNIFTSTICKSGSSAVTMNMWRYGTLLLLHVFIVLLLFDKLNVCFFFVFINVNTEILYNLTLIMIISLKAQTMVSKVYIVLVFVFALSCWECWANDLCSFLNGYLTISLKISCFLIVFFSY